MMDSRMWRTALSGWEVSISVSFVAVGVCDRSREVQKGSLTI